MAGQRGGPTTIGGARKARRPGVFSWRSKRGERGGWKERNRVVGSTAQAQQKKLLASAGWISSRESTIIVWIRRLSRPPPFAVAPGGRRWWEGEGLKTKRKTKEHPVRRIAPSMAYLHPLGGVARPPLFRNDSLNTARSPPRSFSLSLSQRAARLLPIHPLGMPPFHPVTSGTAPEISCTSLARVRSMRLCDRVYIGSHVCEDEHAPKRIAAFPDARFLTLCLEREGGARTNDGENATAAECTRFSASVGLHRVYSMGNRSSFLRRRR